MYNQRILLFDVERCAVQGCRCVLCNSYHRHSEEYKPKTFFILFCEFFDPVQESPFYYARGQAIFLHSSFDKLRTNGERWRR